MNQLSENVRQQFCANYLGQRIFMTDNYIKPSVLTVIHLAHLYGYLLLRKVEQLTDEEVTIIAQITGIDEQLRYAVGYRHREVKEYLSSYSYRFHFSTSGIVLDYLRSIGILTSFTYLQDNKPQTLTPEQIVEMGWMRIKID